jgi:hypothetical protein
VHEASCVATHEAAFGYEALLRNMKNEKRALRFMAAKPPFHRSRRASASYSPKANASLTMLWIYDIIISTNNFFQTFGLSAFFWYIINSKEIYE